MNADQIKRKMAENSRKWHTATSDKERDRLHNENISLSSKLDNASYDRDSGKWSVLKYDKGKKGATGGKKSKADIAREVKEKVSLGIVDDPMAEKAFQFIMKPFEKLGLVNREEYDQQVLENRKLISQLNKESEYLSKYQNYNSTVFDEENKLKMPSLPEMPKLDFTLLGDEQLDKILKIVLIVGGLGVATKIFK